MKVWISRDKFRDKDYCLWKKKPYEDDGAYFCDDAGSLIFLLEPKNFSKVINYKLKPGKCKRVEITVREVK